MLFLRTFTHWFPWRCAQTCSCAVSGQAWMVQAVVPAHLAGGFLEKGLCGSSLVSFLDFKFWVRALTVTEKCCKALLSGSWWNQSRNRWKWIVPFFFNPRFIPSALLFQEIGYAPCVCTWTQDSEHAAWYVRGCVNTAKNHFVVFFASLLRVITNLASGQAVLSTI